MKPKRGQFFNKLKMNFQNSKEKSLPLDVIKEKNEDMSATPNELISRNELETQHIGANQNSKGKNPSRNNQMEQKVDDDDEEITIFYTEILTRIVVLWPSFSSETSEKNRKSTFQVKISV